MRITDAAHLGLMLSALALTYLVPFEWLLLAYVVLGPAHYAPELSWLSDLNSRLAVHARVHGAWRLSLRAKNAMGADRALSRRHRAHSGRATHGRDSRSIIRQSGERLLRQCGARAEPSVRRTGTVTR